MNIVQFPSVGTQVDLIMEKFWHVINDLPDDTSLGAVIAALHITAFDVTEQLQKRKPK